VCVPSCSVASTRVTETLCLLTPCVCSAEELNVITDGYNGSWPCFEGVALSPHYNDDSFHGNAGDQWLTSTESWNRPACYYEHPQPPPPNNVMSISAITTVGDQQVRPANCLWDGAVLLMWSLHRNGSLPESAIPARLGNCIRVLPADCHAAVSVPSLLLLPSIVQIVGDSTQHASDQLANFVATGVIARDIAPCQLRTLPSNTVAFVDFDKGSIGAINFNAPPASPSATPRPPIARIAPGQGLLDRGVGDDAPVHWLQQREGPGGPGVPLERDADHLHARLLRVHPRGHPRLQRPQPGLHRPNHLGCPGDGLERGLLQRLRCRGGPAGAGGTRCPSVPVLPRQRPSSQRRFRRRRRRHCRLGQRLWCAVQRAASLQLPPSSTLP